MVFDKVIFNEASFSLKGGAMINRTDFQRDNFILSVVFFQGIVKIYFLFQKLNVKVLRVVVIYFRRPMK